MPRPITHDDDLRLRLIDAAAALLAVEGPAALNMRRVAGAVGTSTTAIYSLLGSKEALVREMYVEGFARLGKRLEEVPVTDDSRADLVSAAVAYHESALDSPNLYELMFGRPVLEFCPSAHDTRFALGTFELLVGFVQRGVDAGTLRGDTRSLAVELWALNHGVTSLALANMIGPRDQSRAHLRRLVDAALVGYQR